MLRSLHWFAVSFEMLLAEQTVPDTETIATLIRNATNNANPLSISKH